MNRRLINGRFDIQFSLRRGKDGTMGNRSFNFAIPFLRKGVLEL